MRRDQFSRCNMVEDVRVARGGDEVKKSMDSVVSEARVSFDARLLG